MAYSTYKKRSGTGTISRERFASGAALAKHGRIFTTHIPSPTRFRPMLGDLVSQTNREAAQACEAGRNGTKVFLFPTVMLCQPSSTQASGQSRSHSTREILHLRTQLWRTGQHGTLCNAAIARVTRRTSKILTRSEQKQVNIRRSLSVGKEGACGKAAQALGSALGVLLARRAVSEALRAKHPRATPDSHRTKFSPIELFPTFNRITAGGQPRGSCFQTRLCPRRLRSMSFPPR